LPIVTTEYLCHDGCVVEFDDSGRDDDGNVIAETSDDSATAATNGTSSGKTGSGKYRREINKKVGNL